MRTDFFNEFLKSGDTLQIYEGHRLIFSSTKDRLLPLLEYIDSFSPCRQGVIIFDKIVGSAAALLSIKAGCHKVYSPLGSQLAIETLDRYGIKYHFAEIVPFLQGPGGEDVCPMEKLSIGKARYPAQIYSRREGSYCIRGIPARSANKGYMPS